MPCSKDLWPPLKIAYLCKIWSGVGVHRDAILLPFAVHSAEAQLFPRNQGKDSHAPEKSGLQLGMVIQNDGHHSQVRNTPRSQQGQSTRIDGEGRRTPGHGPRNVPARATAGPDCRGLGREHRYCRPW